MGYFQPGYLTGCRWMRSVVRVNPASRIPTGAGTWKAALRRAGFPYAGFMAKLDPAGVTGTLLARRHVFKAFLASRVGNEADAEDLLQNGLVRAMERSDEIKDQERAVAWFYQVLRNVLIDHVRSRGAAAKRDDAWASSAMTLADDREAERQICACFERMLPALKPAQAELIRRVELNGERNGGNRPGHERQQRERDPAPGARGIAHEADGFLRRLRVPRPLRVRVNRPPRVASVRTAFAAVYFVRTTCGPRGNFGSKAT